MGGLYLTAQQPPRRMFRSAALRGVFGFVLVVVGLVVFDYVVLATEEGDHTWKEKENIVTISLLNMNKCNSFWTQLQGFLIF